VRHTIAKQNSYTGPIVLTLAAVALGWILAYRQMPVPAASKSPAESPRPVVSGSMAIAAFGSNIILNAAAGNSIKVTLRGDVATTSIANPLNGQLLTLFVCQDAAGSHQMNWPSNVSLAGDAIILSAEPNQCDAITMIYDGDYWLETARTQHIAIPNELESEAPSPDKAARGAELK
jgi:hypothetical protein